MPALDIVNDVLLDGMKVVGELFGSGQMQLPFVLQSAETMKTAVAYLEPHMERVDGSSAKGKLVLATVKGDVHDIGKNLVDIICTNNGYEVHNLGIKVPIGEMVAKVKEVDADALGMSGLLVKSTLIMRENLEELNSLGLADIPVLLGGAALTRRYVERDLREIYEGRLFYGRDAFEGLSTLDALMTMKRTGEWDPDFGRVPTGRVLPERSGDAVAAGRPAPPVARRRRRQRGVHAAVPRLAGRQGHLARRHRRVHQRDRAVPQPVAVPAGEGRAGKPESDDEFKARIRATFREQLGAAKASGVLVPQVVYGYFPANGDGDDLVVWTDESRTDRGRPVPLPAPEGGAVPVHRRLLPADRVRARSTTPRSTSSRWAPPSARRRRSCSPPTSTSSTCCCTGSASRWPRRSPSTGTAASARSGASSTRTARRSAGCSASSTAAAATRGATRRAPTSRTTPPSPSCSAPTGSASRSARRPAGSTSPSRPPRRSSATTRRPSTSSPAEHWRPSMVSASRHEPTVVVVRRARPGREREFERWIRRLVNRAADAPGAVDAELQPPDGAAPR